MKYKSKTGHESYDSALNGISNFQAKNYPDLIKVKYVNKYFSLLNKLLIKFLTENNLPLDNSGSDKARYKNANIVQDNWTGFKKWISNQ